MTPILPLGYHEPLQSLHTLFARFLKEQGQLGQQAHHVSLSHREFQFTFREHLLHADNALGPVLGTLTATISCILTENPRTRKFQGGS